jgi:hypothetical protein
MIHFSDGLTKMLNSNSEDEFNEALHTIETVGALLCCVVLWRMRGMMEGVKGVQQAGGAEMSGSGFGGKKFLALVFGKFKRKKLERHRQNINLVKPGLIWVRD